MPNITLYLKDELYKQFDNLGEVAQSELRQKCISLIENKLKKDNISTPKESVGGDS